MEISKDELERLLEIAEDNTIDAMNTEEVSGLTCQAVIDSYLAELTFVRGLKFAMMVKTEAEGEPKEYG